MMRRMLAPLFVVLCLTLSGLVVLRLMAAHPRPARGEVDDVSAADGGSPGRGFGGGRGYGGEGRYGGPRQVASERVRAAALATVRGQLAALRAGDGVKAMSYMSREMRGGFALSPDRFEQMMVRGYPEFGRCRSAQFGTVWTDADADRVGVRVTATGENGRTAQARYLLMREDGRYLIADVRGGDWRDPDRDRQ